MAELIEYDEFGFFHENAEEFGLPYAGPPIVRREFVEVGAGRRLSGLVWGAGEPEVLLLHGGSQNAHTWDTVAMALDRPLVALDLPGHGHSDGPPQGPTGGIRISAQACAEDVAVAARALAPQVGSVVGMSLGGLVTIALTAKAPELVRKVILVDVTPGVHRNRAQQLTDFVNGPSSFANFDEILDWTIRHNPTRSFSSLRRGILHNAVQRDDGTWVWRWARWRRGEGGRQAGEHRDRKESAEIPQKGSATFADLWDIVSKIQVPLMLARGMLPQSVVSDVDERELMRRLPQAVIVRFPHAGHNIQGETPVELARSVAEFVAD